MAEIAALLVLFAAGDQGLDAIENAYQVNRESISFGAIRFEFAYGKATDLDAAKGGNWTEKYVANGLYLFDGPLGRYERVFSLEDRVATRHRISDSPGNWSKSLPFSVRRLTNGMATLTGSIIASDDGKADVHVAGISGGAKRFYKDVDIPLRLGDPAGGPLLYAFAGARDTNNSRDFELADVHDDATLGAASVTMLAFVTSSGARQEFWIDLKRGAVPLQVVSTSRVFSQWTLRDELTFVAGKAWLPFRELVFKDSGHVSEIVVTSADFEHRPQLDDFKIEFPDRITVVDAANMRRFAARKTYYVADLAPGGGEGAKPIEIVGPSPPPPEMPGERESTYSSWSWTFSIFGLALVLLGGAVYAWKRYRGP